MNMNKPKTTSKALPSCPTVVYLATLATRAPVPSHQLSYISVLANILDFFNRTSELCNHSDPSPLMTLRVGQRSPWQLPVAWEEKMIGKGKKKSNVGQHK